MAKYYRCTCGKLFTDGARLGKHRSRCVEFNKKKYYTTANLEQVRKFLKKWKEKNDESKKTYKAGDSYKAG